jgi:hypothetical protein
MFVIMKQNETKIAQADPHPPPSRIGTGARKCSECGERELEEAEKITINGVSVCLKCLGEMSVDALSEMAEMTVDELAQWIKD